MLIYSYNCAYKVSCKNYLMMRKTVLQNECLKCCRFLVGNPGDYAWGRENFDAIVTQLLNQIESTGPPPLAKEKISEIPVVYISQEQVGM